MDVELQLDLRAWVVGVSWQSHTLARRVDLCLVPCVRVRASWWTALGKAELAKHQQRVLEQQRALKRTKHA